MASDLGVSRLILGTAFIHQGGAQVYIANLCRSLHRLRRIGSTAGSAYVEESRSRAPGTSPPPGTSGVVEVSEGPGVERITGPKLLIRDQAPSLWPGKT